jgi:hypothetical protein
MLFYVTELTEKRELELESELFPRLRSSALLDRLDGECMAPDTVGEAPCASLSRHALED